MIENYPRATWAMPTMVTAENWRELADDVDGAMASISNRYDPVAAGNLIRFFHFALQDGALFDHCDKLSEAERGLIDFIAYAFKRYCDGDGKKSLDVAFGIERGRGRASEGNDERNIVIAASVEQAIRRDRRERGTENMESVCNEVATKCTVGWKSVEKIYADFRVSIATLGDAEIAALAEGLNK